MLNLTERRKTLEVIMQQKLTQLNQTEEQRNKLTTEIVEIRGKLGLLAELEKESSEKTPAPEA
jgi:hypothetical protein